MSSFEVFFKDPLYLFYKNHLYNYLLRRRAVQRKMGKGRRRILELGCGISPMLEASGRTVQTDVSWQALSYLKKMSSKQHTIRLVACDAGRLPFQEGSFDGIVCSEVLEHIEDDQKVLEEIARVTRTGGELVLTCPIHQRLFGCDDEFVGHYRRYEVSELLQELSRQGFQVSQVRAILGSLEKTLSILITRLFAVLREKENSAPLPRGIRILAWCFFPLYLLISYLLAGLIFLEAQFVSLERATTVCLQCQKSS